jgi:hypothetical protein
VSAKFPVPLTPAGWAFGIWGLIFALEGWGCVYQLSSSGYDADGFKARFANATNVNWIAAWLACSGWQFAFVQQTPGGMWLAFVLILTGLLAMGRALLQLYRWLPAATARSMLACACGCCQVMKGSTRACCGA